MGTQGVGKNGVGVLGMQNTEAHPTPVDDPVFIDLVNVLEQCSECTPGTCPTFSKCVRSWDGATTTRAAKRLMTADGLRRELTKFGRYQAYANGRLLTVSPTVVVSLRIYPFVDLPPGWILTIALAPIVVCGLVWVARRAARDSG